MPTLRQLFLVFLKMGAFAFGGVYSMLTFIERALVENRKWLKPDEFAEGIAIGSFLLMSVTAADPTIVILGAGVAGALLF